MITKKVQALIKILEETVYTLEKDTPGYKKKVDFARYAIETLQDANSELHRRQLEATQQAREIDRLRWQLRSEEANKEAIRKQNRDYLHRMKTAGINYSPYQ